MRLWQQPCTTLDHKCKRFLCSRIGEPRVKQYGRHLNGTVRNGGPVGVAVSVEGEAGRKPSLEPLIRLVAEDLKAVNQVIIERMDSPVALIPQLASHVVAAGGKRLRPMLTLAAARLCAYPGRCGDGPGSRRA